MQKEREKSRRIGKTAICHPFVNPTSFGKDVISFIWTQSEVFPLWAPLLQAKGDNTRGYILGKASNTFYTGTKFLLENEFQFLNPEWVIRLY
jgi:hypothetical protein